MLAALTAAAIVSPVCRSVPLDTIVSRYAALQMAQDTGAIAKLFGRDGVVSHGDDPIRGEAAVRTFLDGFKGYKVSANVLTIERVARARRGWRADGRFDQSGTSPDGTAYHATGHFISRWHCAGGGWRIDLMETGK